MKSEIDSLFEAARDEQPPRALAGKRKIYERLALGGLLALLYAHARPRHVGFAVLGACALLVTGAIVVRPHEAPAAVPTVINAPVVAPAITAATENAAIPSISIDALPTVSAPRAVPAESSLERETKSLAGVRRLVDASDPSALSALREHRRQFPNGVLDQEATVLEIEALTNAHDPRACAVGHAFLDSHPGSAHRTRVTTLLRSCED